MAPGPAWSHLARACRVERCRIDGRPGEPTREVSDAVTSCPPRRAAAGRPLAVLRGHRGSEDKLHRERDVSVAEARARAIALRRRAGHAPIAAACRTAAGRHPHAIALAAAGLTMMK